MPPRNDTDTRALWIPEVTPGSDAGAVAGYVIPNAGFGYGDTADPVRVSIGMGDTLPDSLIAGIIRSGGSLTIGLEYDFLGFPLRALWTGYSRVDSMHEFYEDSVAGARPATFQLQSDFLEAAAQYLRGRYNRVSALELRGDVQGGGQYSVQVTGVGDHPNTNFGGAVTNLGFAATNYFDGQLRYKVDGVTHAVAGINAFSCRPNRATPTFDAFFNNGASYSVGVGRLTVDGELGLAMNAGGTGPMADLNFYSDAVNRKVVSIDWLLADGPLLSCTKYFRTQIIAAFVFRMTPKPAPGTGNALAYAQRFETSRMAAALMRASAEYHAKIRGPYNITAANNKLGVKIDGAATIATTLTQGAARTTDQVVADLSGDVGFAAVATADNFLGWPRITAKSSGATSSVQIDTATANTGHALFGFDNVVRGGRDNCVARQFVFNARTTNY